AMRARRSSETARAASIACHASPVRVGCPAMPDLQPALPHGELREIFGGIFFVTGTSRATFMGLSWQFSRNMTVVREGKALTIVNSVRLNDVGLRALDALGKVTNIVKIGAFHGIDDAFYLERYGARLWALPGATHDNGKVTDVELKVGGPMPIANSRLFVF